jgi:EAL domain-containing protein (putative c-di-GMP-specific phosphodiesterase class I)
MEVVGVATNADEAIAMALIHHPDVVLVDVKMPGGGGSRAAREIIAAAPQTRVVALSAHEDRGSVMDMLRAGVIGYVVKGSPAEEILATVRSSVLGQASLSAGVTGHVVHELAGQLERQERVAIDKRLQLERVLSLLENPGLLQMVYQPIAHIGDGRVAGVEALARFHTDPPRTPDVWFAEAREAGLAVELELAAIGAALGALGSVPPDTYLSINMSPSTATTTRFADLIDEFPAERIVIEVTEHARVDDYEELKNALHDMRTRGVRLAIDDAGAGFASLRHILQLEPDFIKLDMSLTRDIDTDRARRALAAGLISFGSQMGVRIVAEGIETRAELDTLRTLGATFGQGYFLAMPGPIPESGYSIDALRT